MIKYAPLALFLFVFQLHAMEIIKQNPSIPCDDVCYLNQMPRDILDCIAGFLMETEEKFVARTLAEKKEKDRKYDDLRQHEVHLSNEHLQSRSHKRAINLSENGTRLLLFDGIGDDSIKSYKYTQEYKQFERLYCHCCALSFSGTMIAMFYKKLVPEHNTWILELLKVSMEDVPEQKCGNLIIEERREILRDNKNIAFRSLAFNQQGWQLIAWHLSSDDTVNKGNYKIFPVPTSCSSTNRLQEYLRDKFVCNKFIEGKK
jgi:hypothetical protein